MSGYSNEDCPDCGAVMYHTCPVDGQGRPGPRVGWWCDECGDFYPDSEAIGVEEEVPGGAEQPDFSLSFVENRDTAVRTFECVCGEEVVGPGDSRQPTVIGEWDRAIECGACGREWCMFDDGFHWESRGGPE